MAIASLIPIAVVVATFGAFFARREIWDLFTIAGMFLCEVISQFLKRLIKEPRPNSCAAVDFCSTFGMPSSHTQIFSFFTTASTLHLQRRRRASEGKGNTASTVTPLRDLDPLVLILTTLSWPTTFAVASSRVYLGYHSRAHVCVGFAVGTSFGAAWHALCCTLAAAAKGVLTRGSTDACSMWVRAAKFMSIRDTSLMTNPVGVQRMSLHAGTTLREKRSRTA